MSFKYLKILGILSLCVAMQEISAGKRGNAARKKARVITNAKYIIDREKQQLHEQHQLEMRATRERKPIITCLNCGAQDLFGLHRCSVYVCPMNGRSRR